MRAVARLDKRRRETPNLKPGRENTGRTGGADGERVPADLEGRRSGDQESVGVVAMTPDRSGGRRRGLEPALSDERRLLIYRYMEEGSVLGDELDEEIDDGEEPPQEVEASGPHLVAEATLARLPLQPAASNDDERRVRRGRPPGRKARGQVHFHVDAEQDRMLLAAAGRFGSQQKALIAALQSLDEVRALREQVDQLRAECERQRRLLADARALFKSTDPAA